MIKMFVIQDRTSWTTSLIEESNYSLENINLKDADEALEVCLADVFAVIDESSALILPPISHICYTGKKLFLQLHICHALKWETCNLRCSTPALLPTSTSSSPVLHVWYTVRNCWINQTGFRWKLWSSQRILLFPVSLDTLPVSSSMVTWLHKLIFKNDSCNQDPSIHPPSNADPVPSDTDRSAQTWIWHLS